jgi:hypothetical protein
MRGLVLLLVLIAGCGSPPQSNPAAPPSKVTATSEELKLQDDRVKYIKELQDQQIVSRILGGGEFPLVFVGPAWFMLTFDEKSRHMSVVFAYYQKPAIKIYDDAGKQIAQYYERGLVIY